MARRHIHSADKPAITGAADDGSVHQPAGLPSPADTANRTVSAIPPLHVVPEGARAEPQVASMGAFNAPVLPHLPPIIRSKIEPPPLRPTTLTRHRLLDRLPFHDPKRLTLVVADAGFGKTTLLADFSGRYPGRCLWYRLDATDRDWVTLVNYIVASVREVLPDFGKATSTLLVPITGASPSKQAVVGSLIHELGALADQPTTIVFDDFQSLDDSEDAAELLGRLLRDAPASVAFIFSTRRRPTMPLARWSAMGDMVELSTDDLRFSTAETDRLFSEAYGQPLESEVVEELDKRTQGWAASLQLFHSLVRGRSSTGVRSAIRSLTGASGPVYDFLAEEVLDQMPTELQQLALRTSVLEAIVPEYVAAAFEPGEVTVTDAVRLIGEAEKVGIVNRTSQAGPARQFHPLMREFLQRKLGEQLSAAEIAALHSRIARVAESVDLITASHHYIEAGEPSESMRCLAESVIQTMGSGRWGAASRLIDRLTGVPADPAVLAIQARRLFEGGELTRASALLDDLDVSMLDPTVRAVLRNTRLALGWRRGDSDAMYATVDEIIGDEDTPEILRDIAQVFIDASPSSPSRTSLPALAGRLRRMAQTQLAAGHDYYAAISLHNASGAALNAGRFADATDLAHEAIATYGRLPFDVGEQYSAQAMLAVLALEQGRVEIAERWVESATQAENADGDVHAEIGTALAAIGDRSRATRLLERAEALERLGRLDMEGRYEIAMCRSQLLLPSHPSLVVQILEQLPKDGPLDFGYRLLAHALLGVALLLREDESAAASSAEAAWPAALAQDNRRAQARLRLVTAAASGDASQLRNAILQATDLGHLALLTVADAIGPLCHLLMPPSPELTASIEVWPARWRPILRRQLERGNTPAGHAAAELLDMYGDMSDVGRLRAFGKTYRRRGRVVLGRALAQKVSPPLEIQDLGRGVVRIGERTLAINDIRRKPASLLLYLVTRPNYTATREQVLEDLWPDGDPESGANSLNQSLHFIRHELDHWYEMDVSHDYISFESELLWLDEQSVHVSSVDFLESVRQVRSTQFTAAEAEALISKYTGQFCPEFEYDEWAISWRSRLHAAYLDFAQSAIRRLVALEDFAVARDIAGMVLTIDPLATDIERTLIWLYSHLGSNSAAETQYQHYSSSLRADGLDVPALRELTGPHLPA